MFFFFLFLFSALDLISLKISEVFIQYGQSDIEISCVVNCSNQINVNGIQLIRSNEPILSLTSNNEIRWHDLELGNRSEATAKASCSDGDVSYLHMEIPSSRIKPVKDSGPYMCRLRGFKRHDIPFQENSEIITLNITGNRLNHLFFTRTILLVCLLVNAFKVSNFNFIEVSALSCIYT